MQLWAIYATAPNDIQTPNKPYVKNIKKCHILPQMSYIAPKNKVFTIHELYTNPKYFTK